MKQITVALFIFSRLLSFCSSPNVVTPSATSPILIETQARPPATATEIPSTPTIVPSPTTMPGPWFGIPITLEKTNQVRQLAIWGKGIPWSWEPVYSGYWDSRQSLADVGLENLWRLSSTSSVAQGKNYLVQTPRGIYLYSSSTGEQIAEIEDVSAYKVSDDRNTILTGHNNGLLKVWNALDGSFLMELEAELQFEKDVSIAGPGILPTVGDIALSHDGTLIAAGYADNSIVIWDTSTFEISRVLHPFTSSSSWGGIRAIAFSPDDKFLFTLTNSQAILWQLSDGTQVWQDTYRRGQAIGQLFSPDGTMVSFYWGGYFWVLNSNDGSVITRLIPQNDREQAAFLGISDTWEYLFTDYVETSAREIRQIPTGSFVEKTETPEVTFPVSLIESGHLSNLEGAKRLEDKSVLTWGSTNSLIYWWNFEQNELVSYPKENEKAFFSPDGRFGAICQKGSIDLYSIEGIYKSFQISAFQTCDGIVFAPNQDEFAVWKNNRLGLVSMTTGEVQNITSHQNAILGGSYSNDGALLAIAEATYPGKIHVWETRPVKKRLEITVNDDFYWEGRMADYYVLAFSPDDATLLSRGYGNPVRLWNAQDGGPTGVINVSADVLALSPDQRIVATGNRAGMISLWELPDGQKLTELRGHAHIFERVTGINDTEQVLSFPPDGMDTLTYQYERDSVAPPGTAFASLSFLSDGTGLLSVGADGTVRLWGIDPQETSPVSPAPITYPIFDTISSMDEMKFDEKLVFSVFPVASAKVYEWRFFQDNAEICSIQVLTNTVEVTKDSECGKKIHFGEFGVVVRAIINNDSPTKENSIRVIIK